MNQTVTRIVEILFQDHEMTDEVRTIKDEVLSNCQERFEDCVARGLTEDEAIAAVLESLKGMDEVLADYPKKPDAFAYTVDQPQQVDDYLRFSASGIKLLDASLMAEDIELLPGHEDCLVVDTDGASVEVKLEGSKLRINHIQKPMNVDTSGFTKSFEGFTKDGNGWRSERKWNGLGDMLGSLGSMMKDFGRAVQEQVEDAGFVHGKSATIKVYVPMHVTCDIVARSTSGDITVRDIRPTTLKCESMSGDVKVETIGCRMHEASLRSTSGDVKLTADADRINLSTMSGDAALRGGFGEVNVQTVSGDVEMEGVFSSAAIKTVSGDADVRLTERVRARVQMNSTSGDMELILPDHTMTAHIQANTVSGDVTNHYADAGEHSEILLTAHTVSGDVSVK